MKSSHILPCFWDFKHLWPGISPSPSSISSYPIDHNTKSETLNWTSTSHPHPRGISMDISYINGIAVASLHPGSVGNYVGDAVVNCSVEGESCFAAAQFGGRGELGGDGWGHVTRHDTCQLVTRCIPTVSCQMPTVDPCRVDLSACGSEAERVPRCVRAVLVSHIQIEVQRTVSTVSYRVHPSTNFTGTDTETQGILSERQRHLCFPQLIYEKGHREPQRNRSFPPNPCTSHKNTAMAEMKTSANPSMDFTELLEAEMKRESKR